MKITMHNPPEGYLAEAEYRIINKGELYLWHGKPMTASGNSSPYYYIALTPVPPPPKKKVVKRFEVIEYAEGWFEAGESPFGDWLSRADFRGFVYQLDGRDEVIASSPLIWWSPTRKDWAPWYSSGDGYTTPVRPVAVLAEVEE